MINSRPVSVVQKVVVKVCTKGKRPAYLQKYSRVWECQEEFAGKTCSTFMTTFSFDM